MPNYHNIEKLPGKGYYTGYANGTWRISRNGHVWTAIRNGDQKIINKSTLGELSEALDTVAKECK